MTGEQLRQRRLRQGITQQEVVSRLQQLAWARERQRVGVNADMLSKWERGEKRPSALYRRLLCALYSAAPAELGFAPDSGAGVGRAGVPREGARTGGRPGLLDQLGDGVDVLHAQLRDMWAEEFMRRRELLQLMGLAPLVATPDALTGASWGPSSLAAGDQGEDPVEALEDLAGRYRSLYHSADPEQLLPAVRAHLRTVKDFLRNMPQTVRRRRLLRNESEVALLAGRLSFFDLRNSEGARHYLHLAVEAAREAHDHNLAALALGHSAFLPAAEARFEASSHYVFGAAMEAEHSHPQVQAWLAAVESETWTIAGDQARAMSAVDRAEHTLQANELTGPPPAYFDYFDAARLAGFQGSALSRFGNYPAAATALMDAADGLAPHAVKQRAVYSTDLAIVRLHQNEIEEGCRLASDAADALSAAGYATATDRLRGSRALVEPWKNHPGVRMLDEQLIAR